MQSKTYSEEQILSLLKAAEAKEKSVTELCREHGVNTKTYYRWKKKYAGVEDTNQLKELKKLRDENTRLKKLVAEQAMDIDLLKEVNAKKW